MPIINLVYEWYKWWTPWANTIAYYPFRSDILDHSWNNKNFTGSWYSFANNMITTTSTLTWPIVTPENTTWDRTINVWCYRASWYYCFRSSNIGTDWWINPYESENWYRPWVSFKLWNTWYRNYPSASDLPAMWSIILMTRTKTGTTMKLYVNWVLTSTNSSLDTATWTSPNWITKTYLDPWTYWEIIVEDKIWTDAEIQNYYNQTKSNYGL